METANNKKGNANDKKIYFTLTDCLGCSYRYKIVNKDKKGKATILELSSKGLIMITKEFLRPGKTLEIDIEPPLGPLTLSADVGHSKLEWYIDDKQKDMFFTTHLVFKNISIKKRTYVISYIYKCKNERRKARYRKPGL